ncbi:DUF3348 family protein [Ramlibacter humi]|uniref:DUF3348 family protein n=1 Tax=Ramlibacter humi TaxID=2530451 RepID=UPI001430E929|nr:DUF3348 family protein [Ramlibacter humi]
MQSTFGSSNLVRRLAPWGPTEAEPGLGVAERLAAWVGPLQAIQLQAVNQAVGTPAAGSKPGAKADLTGDVQRVRGVLASAIAKDPLALAGIKPGDTEDHGYGPWQQRHIELQRQMGQMCGALRDHARQTVSRASPRLRQLATLDAAFEQLLADREAALLPQTLSHLERRYKALRAAHRATCEATGQPDDPARWRAPGGWLRTFSDDWRQVLLAELDLRLEAVTGLAEALRQPSLFET